VQIREHAEAQSDKPAIILHPAETVLTFVDGAETSATSASSDFDGWHRYPECVAGQPDTPIERGCEIAWRTINVRARSRSRRSCLTDTGKLFK
jgi:hypothetical protein